MQHYDSQVWRLRLRTPTHLIDDILDAACLDAAMPNPPGAWEDVETGEAWVEVFGTDEAAMLAAASRLEALARTFGFDALALVEPLAQEDWTESWKRYFHVIRVSDRVVIRPAWEEYEAKDGEIVIAIEPGMSFGTGLHATTRACVGFIESLSEELRRGHPRMSVADMGCGSGILAIAARKSGFADVRGFDFDPLAVKVSRENAALNGLPEIPFAVADILAPPLPKADVFVANILAPILEEAAPFVRDAVNPGGFLILSGILATQYGSVKNVYEKLGFRERETSAEGEWKSGLFQN